MSITPALIFAAIIAQASNPEEQSLFIDTIGVVSGIPAMNAAILCGISPAPDYKLFPTVISPILFGSIFDLSIKALKTGVNNPSGVVSFNPPLFAFVNGVLKAATITTSSSLLSVIEQVFGFI
jgi:hypothetical protein